MCKPNGSKTSVRKEGEGTQTPKSPEAVPGLRSIQQWAVVLQQRAALLNGAGLAEKGENTVFFSPRRSAATAGVRLHTRSLFIRSAPHGRHLIGSRRLSRSGMGVGGYGS